MSRRTRTDAQWARIADLVPGKAGDPGATGKDTRRFIDAVLWMARTGSPWRDLPGEFGPWNTVHKRFLEWAKLEVWDDLLRMLSINADPEAIIIDATFIKLHQHGTGAKGGTSIRRSGVARVD